MKWSYYSSLISNRRTWLFLIKYFVAGQMSANFFIELAIHEVFLHSVTSYDLSTTRYIRYIVLNTINALFNLATHPHPHHRHHYFINAVWIFSRLIFRKGFMLSTFYVIWCKIVVNEKKSWSLSFTTKNTTIISIKKGESSYKTKMWPNTYQILFKNENC